MPWWITIDTPGSRILVEEAHAERLDDALEEVLDGTELWGALPGEGSYQITCEAKEPRSHVSTCCDDHLIMTYGVTSPTTCHHCGRKLVVRDKKWVYA